MNELCSPPGATIVKPIHKTNLQTLALVMFKIYRNIYPTIFTELINADNFKKRIKEQIPKR